MTDDPPAATPPEVDATGDGPGPGRRARPDAGGVAVGVAVALSGALFLLQSVVEWIAVGPLRIRPVALSGATLALGFSVGGVVFLAGGRRLIGIGHAGMGAGWTLVVAGTVGGVGLAVPFGAALVVGTALFLASESRGR